MQKQKVGDDKSRSYHPQSQGKVQWSHRSLRKKITSDFPTQKQAGVNWSKKLQKYEKCYNNEKREELGWKSAFVVYFSRKSSELRQCGMSIEKDRESVVQPLLHSLSEISSDNEWKTLKAREAVKK